MFAVIVGCGRLGSHIAIELSKAGNNVVVIDRNKDAFSLLSSDFSGFQVTGDAIDWEILKNARADEADVIAAVTDDDNVNIMVAQVAREIFGVRRVFARVGDPLKGETFSKTGLSVLSPTTVAAKAFEAEILGETEG
jgi:trk system potassium uptake protein TrkA